MTELETERAYVGDCRKGLQRMLEGARDTVIGGETVAGDRYSAERLGRHLKSLAKELSEAPDGPPFFGRLDLEDGRRHHIGRRHISGETGHPPLVIDWRAPVSTAFYRAHAGDRRGVRMRRRYGWADLTLTGFEDEHLDGRPQAASAILAAEIERPRVGPMRDIVATIQPEQDQLVRAELDRSICVQGAPGTGKTAVGLHRAAYLLYAHRQRLDRHGVLVLGPNRAFLGYIGAVLPALGEVDVEQTTVDDLLQRVRVTGTDSVEAATVKHDERMAAVLRKALYGRIAKPAEPVAVRDGAFVWRVQQEDLRRIVDDARRAALPYRTGRERVLSQTVALVGRQAELRGRTATAAWTRAMTRGVTAAIDAVWPNVKAEEVLAGLLADPSGPADGILTAGEQQVITRARTRWTAADAVLIDELDGLLDRPKGYGHVIVDEAQDLSPMQCRAIARRSEYGSLTVLGDLAQGTTPWAAADWADQLKNLGKPDATVIALTTGFRVPAAVVELANGLLDDLGADVPRTRSFRTEGQLLLRPAGQAAAAVTAAMAHEGSIGVIAADRDLPGLVTRLRAAGVDLAPVDQPGARVTAVPASMAKGLEYDHVVVVGPEAIVAAEPRGLNRLYVALTRAVSRLDVVGPLPVTRSGAARGPR
ncbi:ATP-binding domain-containing protein [Nonomuraea sp. NPDC003804]|uniref:HelD family protein n=1 Tax=Nonomuraea sp. NPDC003804 TaxID=3154547 RepID=UPI0033BA3FB6